MIRPCTAVLLGLALSPLSLPAHAADCSSAITHFRALIDRDVQSGMLDRSVYDAATHELTGAEKNCQAGHDGVALAELSAIERRHGYH